jgi:hypothetical protein
LLLVRPSLAAPSPEPAGTLSQALRPAFPCFATCSPGPFDPFVQACRLGPTTGARPTFRSPFRDLTIWPPAPLRDRPC